MGGGAGGVVERKLQKINLLLFKLELECQVSDVMFYVMLFSCLMLWTLIRKNL